MNAHSNVLRRTLGALILLSALSVGHGQQPQGGEKKAPHSVGEKTSEAFGKLKPLQEKQDWNGMLAVLEAIPLVSGSYDEALVLDMKAKLYATTNQFTKAIAPWERAVQLADKNGYFAEKPLLEIIFFLGQLFAQEASATKDPKLQQQYFGKALIYFKRFMEKTPKPTPEATSTYAMILYYKAIADPNNVDQKLITEARKVIEKGLQSSIKPRDSFYQLLLTLQQQQNDMQGAADILELLLSTNPAKKDFWTMLMAMYLQLSDKAKDKPTSEARDYLVRAIVTAERAQKQGFMTTAKENMNLVSLYLMANQFTKGTELLYNGMKKGVIENEPHNWRILGRYYQEANMNTQAIAVLTEATQKFPKNGELEVQIAQIYLQQENTRQAFNHARSAAAKGNFDGTKPYSVHYLVAYTAYELGEFEAAMTAINACEKFEEHKKDGQFPRLRDVIKEALAEREAKNKPKAEAAPKKTASNR
jgi:hypothetical protein